MRYYGGQRNLAKFIVPILQKYVDESHGYWEPMCGGCNIIERIEHEHRNATDISVPLIALLRHVQNKLFHDIPETIGPIEYNKIREAWKNKEDYPMWYYGLVGYCASYGGKFFGGYAGESVPPGTIRNLLKQDLDGIRLGACDFRDIPDTHRWVYYCDPPSDDTEFPWEEFYTWCKNMAKYNTVIVCKPELPDYFECIGETVEREKPIRLYKCRIV